jgi:FixJ family two-component response regulator
MEVTLAPVPLVSIIDDDQGVREATQSLIRSLGYDTNSFVSAEEYLRFGRVESPSCLITDVRMPGMSGPDLQDRLVADNDSTPIIFVTAFPDESVRTRVLRAGAHAFLAKPCDDKMLIECLDKALKSKS